VFAPSLRLVRRLLRRALASPFWEAFFLFNDVVTRGCDDNDHVVVEAHAQELDNIGIVFMSAYSEVVIDSHVTVYMHITVCHTDDLVRERGGLMKWYNQGAEAMHQMTKYFALNRSARKVDVSSVVLTRVHMLMKMQAQPSRRKRVRHTGKHITCTVHVSKAKTEVHEQTQNSSRPNTPPNFYESRAVKRARGE
jgi:hypothetical protein